MGAAFPIPSPSKNAGKILTEPASPAPSADADEDEGGPVDEGAEAEK